MTRVAFIYRGGELCGYEARGHAGKGYEGHDIVCAALSSLLTTGANALEAVAGVKPECEASPGTMIVSVPQGAGRDARVVLATVRQGVRDLAAQYPQYVSAADRIERSPSHTKTSDIQ